MMQHLTRTEIQWTETALREQAERFKALSADETQAYMVRALADLQAGNLERIRATLQAVLDDRKALRIAID